MFRLGILFVLAISTGIFFIAKHLDVLDVPVYGVGNVSTVFAGMKGDQGDMLFVGDIMLGRAVETFMDDVSPRYPFEASSDLLNSADFTIGNFEATVPKEHVKTPDFEIQFSVREPFLAQLTSAGINALSLSNNHAFDFGEDAFQNTREACPLYSLTCFGHPTKLDLYSVTYVQLDDSRVGVLALNMVDSNVDEIALGALLSKVTFYSDVQVVYVHWGEEYQNVHSESQERLAHSLIDNGADLIVGHHPHVVQDIELYKGKPIFYSLGNFIFDQYFSDEVQKGLAVRMTLDEEFIEYELIPLTSIQSKSQPHIMNTKDGEAFLYGLTNKSGDNFDGALSQGRFAVSR